MPPHAARKKPKSPKDDLLEKVKNTIRTRYDEWKGIEFVAEQHALTIWYRPWTNAVHRRAYETLVCSEFEKC